MNDAPEASRNELERFFDLSSDLMGIAALDGGFRRVNPAFERTLGYSRQELLSRSFLDIIHPADRSKAVEILDEFSGGDGAARFETRCARSDGFEVWLEWKVVADQGLVYGAGRDVTRRRREQDRLREAQRMLEASRDALGVLAEQQASLRRVATLVARGVAPSEVFSAVAGELARVPGRYTSALIRYQPDGASELLAARDEPHVTPMPVGERFPLEGESVAAMVFRTGRPARMEATRMLPVRPPCAYVSWVCARGWERRSSSTADCGVRPSSGRRDPRPCPPTPRRGSRTSRISSRPRSPTPRPARNSPRHGPGSSRPPMAPDAVSNAICTTAPNSGSSRWG